MKILFDGGVPWGLRRFLVGHDVVSAQELGWAEQPDGELLRLAEPTFDVLVTTDGKLRYQQNFTGRRLAVLVVINFRWDWVRPFGGEIAAEVQALQPGDYREFIVPIPPRKLPR